MDDIGGVYRNRGVAIAVRGGSLSSLFYFFVGGSGYIDGGSSGGGRVGIGGF